MATPQERLGVVRDEATGELILPATQRPDGTWRKPRRVKDGYIPQEEVPVYESKGMQFVKSIPDYPIGLSQEDIEKMRKTKSEANKEETPANQMSKAAKKNAKRKEKRKQQAGSNTSSQGSDLSSSTTKVTSSLSNMKLDSESASAPVSLSKEELAKKIKNLKKKLRQVEDLEEKITSGQLKNPEKEQLEKVKRKQLLLDEIEDLELDLEDD